MFELFNPQLFMYCADKQGAGQACLLCGSILLQGKTDEEKLQQAANTVFRINDSLRTRFVEQEEAVYQEYLPFAERRFEVRRFPSREALDDWARVYGTIPLVLDRKVEGKGLSKQIWQKKKPTAALVRNVISHNTRMFFTRARFGALRRKPCCCELILLELPDACGAIIKLHHAVADGWSVLLIASQFLRALRGETPEAYSYESFVRNEAAYEKTARYQKDAAYEEAEFARLPEPTWVWPEPAVSLEARRRTVVLDRALSDSIRSYAEAHALTPYVMFLTAICVFMARKMKRDLFYIGSVIFNRSGVEERNTAGLFVHGVPLLVELPGSTPFTEALEHVRSKAFAGFRHQKGTVKHQNTGTLLYDLWVSYQNGTIEPVAEAEIRQYYCNYTGDTAILSIEDRAKDSSFTLQFDSNVKISDRDADELIGTIQNVLTKGIQNDRLTLSELGSDGYSRSCSAAADR